MFEEGRGFVRLRLLDGVAEVRHGGYRGRHVQTMMSRSCAGVVGRDHGIAGWEELAVARKAPPSTGLGAGPQG